MFSKRILSAAVLVAAGGAALLVHAQGTARNEPILPLPDAVTDVEPAKVKLGGKLFADPRFSADGSVSCQSCHLPHAGGADPRRHSVSAFGKVRPLNSPTIFNVRYNTVGLNWTGRTKDLDAQIKGSVGNADTMAHDWGKVIQVLAQDQAIASEFKAAFGGDNPVNQANASEAIVAFEKSLVTPSRFDDWLKGKDSAITAQEKAGYEKFKAYGCVACHNGINVGGNSFMKMGLTGNYFADREKKGRGAEVDVDKGKFAVSKKEEDMYVFRVPSLRNVALTAPYFHDGAVPTLDEAIDLMGRFQLGREIPPADRQDIAAFLNALGGKQLEQSAKR
ncbi:cytochrome-c peroxidase [Ramlibacter pallidus]|uniref:C-type cytochrome n=1 Tax=Ramlibacter pallidus TaxID=2780087 RepID=A0ABR9S3Y3_9BURK|nr:cytochrome c peroxidase [Ramlibacter pallidus]MBE7368216.1 c-type cytochrome [Ramlibacter pallidus]